MIEWHIDWEVVSAFATTIAVVIGAVSAFIALRGQKRNNDWNRRKTAEETLTRLVSGDFANLLDELDEHAGWDIVGSTERYTDIAARIKPCEKARVDRLLRRLFRILETIAIHIQHNIIEDDICYEYLSSMAPRVYENCLTFVEQERANRDEPRVYEHFAAAVKRWEARNRKLRS